MNSIEEVQAVRIARVLGDSVRFSIYKHIMEMNEIRFGDICLETPVRASTVSHHLKVLSDAGLIKSRREGQSVFHRSIPEALEAYLKCLRRLKQIAQTSRKVAMPAPNNV